MSTMVDVWAAFDAANATGFAYPQVEALRAALRGRDDFDQARAEDIRKLGVAAGAAFAFVEKLEQLQPSIDGMYHFAYIHGVKYDGPTYEAELKTLRAALSDVGLPPTLDDAQNAVRVAREVTEKE